MPMLIDLARLDEGKGFEITFLDNKAKWHKSCKIKYQALLGPIIEGSYEDAITGDWR